MSVSGETPLIELVDRALAKMATGDWLMRLVHPDPTEGSSSCGFDVPREIALRLGALSAKLAEAEKNHADCRENFHTMQQAANKLRTRAEVAEAKLAEAEQNAGVLWADYVEERTARMEANNRVAELEKAISAALAIHHADDADDPRVEMVCVLDPALSATKEPKP